MAENVSLKVFSRNEVASLFVAPIQAQALAFNPNIATTVSTNGATYRIPLITEDVSASWVAEGAEIPLTGAEADEVVVTPAKVAALTTASREMIEDTTPGAQDALGASIARDIANKIDAAFVGTKGADLVRPKGLADLTGAQTVTANPAALDPYIDALAKLELVGAHATAIITTPEVAAAIAKLRAGTGSNVPLLGADATLARERVLLGLPLFSTPHVAEGTAYVVDSSRITTVLRNDSTLVADSSRYFEYDTVGIRGTARVGWAFAQEASVIRISE